ncbi:MULTISPECIES: ABC1 kinase family protein [Cryobacterium]|uniref:ABC1 kinase family protein n=1 Tax=Cryobacterium TaxID=69578 RepID=UPI0010575A1E|nr:MULTISPECIES: AarF/UbiB family protein [Cryobacterium]TFC44768.1 AarF/ABC1/UbiB kinase family protein [Cryobacterium sp. TMN-39-2]TFC55265.1 AarF/ABC1/UbiB kinase family protein [Cryobacterium sp. TMB3-1-2]TFC71134.1 AarF/ABC1/UbiB kinase family protein [Cryobacterium sp. TMB3-15]TFC77050.1 AarF/ABC1/UbiB kinase family protein [Cryobacterium sp. TMB3-10]TFD46727.1 AarF/ABC1/UbiB kinase family protein [Cryobacterium sp. TMB3-12]
MLESFWTWVVIILVALVFSVAIGFATRSLLGTTVGWLRTFLVGLLVFVGCWPFAYFVSIQAQVIAADGTPTVPIVVVLLFVALAFGWVFALGMAMLVATEALWPTTAANPIDAFRAALHRRRRTKRYLQILTLLSKHGIGWILNERPGGAPREGKKGGRTPDALVSAINEAGVTFVKLGQLLSTRRDLLPASYTRALASLQSGAATLPWPAIRQVIEAEIGGPLETVFSQVDALPLAAASVAQVHAGTLLDGTRVVLKVQRPAAAAQVAADIDIIVRLAQRIENQTSWGRDFGVVTLAEGFGRSLRDELDYRIEFSSTQQIGSVVASSAENEVLVVPRVYAEASSRRLLTMDLIDGLPLNAAGERLSRMDPEDRGALAAALLDAVLEQVIVTGIFHADLHPGNLMLRADGMLGMIDFGNVGVLERSMREGLVTLLLAATNDDDIATTDALLLVVEAPPDADILSLQRDLGRVLTLNRHSANGSIFAAMLDTIRDHHLAVPTSLGQALRSLITLERCLDILDPDFDMVETALARVPHFLRRLVTPKSLLGSLQAQAAVLQATARRLPRRLETISSSLAKGTFSLRIRAFAEPDDRWWIGSVVTEAIGVLIGITAVSLGIVLVVSDTGPDLVAGVRLFAFLGASIGLVGFILLIRALRQLFLRRPHP